MFHILPECEGEHGSLLRRKYVTLLIIQRRSSAGPASIPLQHATQGLLFFATANGIVVNLTY